MLDLPKLDLDSEVTVARFPTDVSSECPDMCSKQMSHKKGFDALPPTIHVWYIYLHLP